MLRLDRMLLGSLSGLAPVPVADPETPDVVVPLVAAPSLAAAAAAAADCSSTGAAGCVEQPTSSAAMAAATRIFFMVPPANVWGCARNGAARELMTAWDQ